MLVNRLLLFVWAMVAECRKPRQKKLTGLFLFDLLDCYTRLLHIGG
jgi:hypothetical protein